MVGVAILVASARVDGGTFGGRMAGIGSGFLMLAAGLGILLAAHRIDIGTLMPVVLGAAIVGLLGGLAAKNALNHRTH
jgi:hypothetical protein